MADLSLTSQHTAQHNGNDTQRIITYSGRRWTCDDNLLSEISSYKLCGVRTETGSWLLAHGKKTSLTSLDLEESLPSLQLFFPHLCTLLLRPLHPGISEHWWESNSWKHVFREVNGDRLLRGMLHLNINQRVVVEPNWRSWLQWIGLLGQTQECAINVAMSITEFVARSEQPLTSDMYLHS